MTSRDDVIKRLNAEIGKLRQQHKERSSDVGRQSDMLKKLQEALTHSHVDLDETRRKADDDVRIGIALITCQAVGTLTLACHYVLKL